MTKTIYLATVLTLLGGILIAGADETLIRQSKQPITDSRTVKTINTERLADAIWVAEGGNRTKHEYGILTKYKNTTPKQACLNTIAHAWQDWDGSCDFISFLGKRYCPVGAKNDPTHLNENWVKNVERIYYESK